MSDKYLETEFGASLSAGQLYRENIPAGSKVALIGPSNSALEDASFLYLTWLLREQGSILVVDPNSFSDPLHWQSAAYARAAGGIGNIDRYLAELEKLRPHLSIISSERVKWLGKHSVAQNTALPENYLDRVVDHFTSTHIVTNRPPSEGKRKEDMLKEILAEYFRILRPGGKLIFQTDREELRIRLMVGFLDYRDPLTQMFKDVGFKVEHFDVADEFDIPIDTGTNDWLFQIQHSKMSAEPNVHLFWQNVRKGKEGLYLAFGKQHHPSPDFYVCEKPNVTPENIF